MNQNRANNFTAKLTFLFDTSIERDNNEPIEYNIQDFTTPSRDLGEALVTRGGKQLGLHGDTIIEDKNVTLQFLLDEELKVLFNLRDIQSNNALGKTYLVNLVILDNKSDGVATASYKKAYIKNISPILYSLKDNDTNIYIDVILGFSDFDIRPIVRVSV